MTRVFSGPDAGQVQGAIEGVTGKFYEPQTIPGQYASTIAEFAPGALMPGGPAGSVARAIAAKTLNTVVPAVTSETAGQLTKDTPYEPYARFAGGLGGGVAGARLVTPIGPAEGAYARAVAALEKEGIPLTAGQRTGSKTLQWTESNAVDMPAVGGQAARIQAAPREALDRAVTQRIYDPAELAARGVPEDVNLPDPRVAVARPAIAIGRLHPANASALRDQPAVPEPDDAGAGRIRAAGEAAQAIRQHREHPKRHHRSPGGRARPDGRRRISGHPVADWRPTSGRPASTPGKKPR